MLVRLMAQGGAATRRVDVARRSCRAVVSRSRALSRISSPRRRIQVDVEDRLADAPRLLSRSHDQRRRARPLTSVFATRRN